MTSGEKTAGNNRRRAFVEALVGAIRLPLWLPVALGLGIAGYFALPVEPPLVVAVLLVFCAGAVAMLARKSMAAGVFVLLFAVAAGFFAAVWRSSSVEAPVLDRRFGPAAVTGEVFRWEEEQGGHGRLTLGRLTIEQLSGHRTPAQIRIVYRTGGDRFEPGDRVRLTAILEPPSAPAFPGDYDYARQLYFAQIGALGFAVGPVERLERGGYETGLSASMERLRVRVSTRIRTVLQGESGAVADALITGYRQALDDEVVEAMRGSGLAHLLAISGLHLGLVTGLVFFVLRALFALSQRLALHYPIKKWAALGAIPAAAFYLVLSGAGIPTVRAFIMAALVLVAILLDRSPISLRLVALAAGVILLLSPEALLSASFQMSFSAVVGLVAAFSAYTDYRARRPQASKTGWGQKIARYFIAIAISTLVAEVVLVPTVLFHFNRMALYGLAANLAAMPIVGIWIMPAAVAAMVLMPFGLDTVPLAVMGEGIDLMLVIARTVSGADGGELLVPAFSTGAYATIMLSFLILALTSGRGRMISVPVGIFGLALAMATPRPDILVDGEAEVMAVRAPDGRYWFSPGRAGKHARSAAAERNGQEDEPRWDWREETYRFRDTAWLSCDGRGCIYAPFASHRPRIALIYDPVAALEDCMHSKIVIAFERLGTACRGTPFVIDWAAIRKKGGHALFLSETGDVTVRTVDAKRGRRPWVR